MSLRDIEAVLTFEHPYLADQRRFNQPVGHFLSVMELMPHRAIEDVSPARSVVGIAARGLAREISGDVEGARVDYDRLTTLSSPTGALLGHCLIAWMPDATAADIESAAHLVPSVSDRIQAMVWCKLTSFAFDQGEIELAHQYLQRAKETTESERLQVQLSLTEHHYFNTGFEIWERTPADWFVDSVWVDAGLGDRARKGRLDELKAVVGGAWRHTRTFGLTPTDHLAALEMQALWAGTMWRLQEIRQQAATYLLDPTHLDRDRAVRGLARWVMGRGDRMDDVADYAEAHFDAESAEKLIRRELRDGRKHRPGKWYTELVAALWDVVPEQVLVELAPDLPRNGLTQVDQPLRQIWNAVGLRVPELWGNLADQMDDDALFEQLANISPFLATHLPAHITLRLYELGARRLPDAENADEDAWSAFNAIDRVLPDSDRQPVIVPSDRLTSLLAAWGTKLVGQEEIRASIPRLVARVREDMEAATSGRMAGYFVSPFDLLGHCLFKLDVVDDQSADLLRDSETALVELAMSSRQPLDYRYDALKALSAIAEGRGWDESLEPLRTPVLIDDAGWQLQFGGGTTRDVLEILRVITVLRAAPDEQLVSDAVIAARHPDPRVRLFAIRGASRAHRREEAWGDQLGDAIVAGLWDPDGSVLRETLRAIRSSSVLTGWQAVAASERVLRLFESSERDIRVEAVRAARRLPSHVGGDILQRASVDRSWRVRSAIQEVESF